MLCNLNKIKSLYYQFWKQPDWVNFGKLDLVECLKYAYELKKALWRRKNKQTTELDSSTARESHYNGTDVTDIVRHILIVKNRNFFKDQRLSFFLIRLSVK